MNKKLYILHSFNARPYFESVEYYAQKNNIQLEYRETNWLKSLVKLLIGKKCVNCNPKAILRNLAFCLQVPFMKNETIIYGTGPYDFRFLWYSILKNNNNFIYHTSHHKWGEDEKSVFLYGLFTPVLKFFWQKILRSQNIKVVAVTKESKMTLENSIKLSVQVNQIYHSINLERFYIESKESFQKIKVLFVGRLVYEKGLDILADVIQNLDKEKFEFTIVGDGNYKEKISHIFENKNVHYLGWINDKDKIASIFKEHDILLNPSVRHKDWEELFGIVNIEAMACGVVVIASNHIGPKEIINDGVNGFLVNENDSNIIIKKLNLLYENREIVSQISTMSIKRANDFSMENIANQWRQIINEK